MGAPKLPDDLDVDTKRLGAHVASYRAGSGRHKLSLGVAVAFTLLFAALALGIGFSKGTKGAGIAAAILGGIGLLPAVGVFVLGRRLGWRVYLFERGFVFRYPGGTDTVLWDDVEQHFERRILMNGIESDHMVDLRLASGKRLVLDATIRDIGGLADAIRRGTTASVLARAVPRLKRGESVAFGKLKVGRDGLDNGKETLGWGDVEKLETEFNGLANQLVIRAGGKKWYTKALPSFPNFDAFLALAERFTGRG
jgi:Family of unknown function (DUF6585)